MSRPALTRCCEPRCRNPRKSDRLRCSKCHQRRFRAQHREAAAFATLRDHARARGIAFTISFSTFRAFARRTEYLTRTGNTAGALTVDRIDNLSGYVPGNIRAISRAENSVKRCKQDASRFSAGCAWKAAA
jgi:hypothetical protein